MDVYACSRSWCSSGSFQALLPTSDPNGTPERATQAGASQDLTHGTLELWEEPNRKPPVASHAHAQTYAHAHAHANAHAQSSFSQYSISCCGSSCSNSPKVTHAHAHANGLSTLTDHPHLTCIMYSRSAQTVKTSHVELSGFPSNPTYAAHTHSRVRFAHILLSYSLACS